MMILWCSCTKNEAQYNDIYGISISLQMASSMSGEIGFSEDEHVEKVSFIILYDILMSKYHARAVAISTLIIWSHIWIGIRTFGTIGCNAYLYIQKRCLALSCYIFCIARQIRCHIYGNAACLLCMFA